MPEIRSKKGLIAPAIKAKPFLKDFTLGSYEKGD
jgi:hypothetical protein